jgi:hypothetical protein
MSGGREMLLTVVVPGGLAVLLALLLVRRERAWLGFFVGTGVILAAQIILQVRLRGQVQACVERACRPITDPAACQAASFGCHEWTGLAALFYLIAAAIDLVLVGVACVIAALILRKRRVSAASRRP